MLGASGCGWTPCVCVCVWPYSTPFVPAVPGPIRDAPPITPHGPPRPLCPVRCVRSARAEASFAFLPEPVDLARMVLPWWKQMPLEVRRACMHACACHAVHAVTVTGPPAWGAWVHGCPPLLCGLGNTCLRACSLAGTCVPRGHAPAPDL